MEARKFLNNLESKYEILEKRYDDIEGAFMPIKEESYEWKKKYE